MRERVLVHHCITTSLSIWVCQALTSTQTTNKPANDGEAIRNIGNAELKGVQRGVDQPLQFQTQRSLDNDERKILFNTDH